MDFTFKKYMQLMEELIRNNYPIKTTESFISRPTKKVVILRHDVDRFPKQSLKMAELESEIGISSTYYFRTRKHTFIPEIIKKIIDLGHEIGYHYENLSDYKGNCDEAIKDFASNLEKLRKYYPVKTICMHGSPLSSWDNKLIWEKYSYRDFDITADTSLDINYNKVFYITDNGWGWNKTESSIRDKVTTDFKIPIRSTNHFIQLLKQDLLPPQIMLNAHPDTFFPFGLKWFANMSFIKSKNIIKRQLVRFNVFN